jgi:hypothetical protein
MKTGIEKFKNVMNPDTCDLLIKHLEDNLDKCDDLNHSNKQNVVCKEIMLEPNSELDTMVLKTIEKVLASYARKYPFFQGRARTGYQLRKITGNTRVHVDRNPDIDDKRNVSVIIGLNSDYEKGEFHFPEQDYITTLKGGEAIVFPVYFTYPHYVDEPIGNRYTINTWIIE